MPPPDSHPPAAAPDAPAPDASAAADPGSNGTGQPNGSSRSQRLIVPVVVLVSLLLVSAVLFLANRQGGDSTEAGKGGDSSTSTVDESLAALARRDPKDALALGEVDAPVVLVAYSEFQCPFCGAFARDTEPGLVKDYVDAGKLRIEWRDFPYLGEESMVAAKGARAAAQQGKFWEFHEAMFARQAKPNTGTLTPAYLTGMAGKVGLDTARFAKDLTSPEVEAAVRKDLEEGQEIGVNGTPSFLINGVPIIGAQPDEVFRKTIDDALAKAGAGS